MEKKGVGLMNLVILNEPGGLKLVNSYQIVFFFLQNPAKELKSLRIA